MKETTDNWRIHQNEDGKWYFWAEDDATEYGPYESDTEAANAMLRYCVEVLGT